MTAWMKKKTALYVCLPLGFLVLYICCTFLFPQPSERMRHWVFSEQGIVEVGTAVFYLTASIVAFLLFCKTAFIGKWRVIYLLVCLACLFIALEEVNYGQYFLGFETPDGVAELNRKDEFNFHNMFQNKPSRYLNTLATLAFPTLFIVLPLVALRRKESYSSGNWPYYILPDKRLIFFVVIGQLMSWYDNLFRLFDISNHWTRATEVKEFYWAAAMMFWTMMLYKRVVMTKTETEKEVPKALENIMV